MTDVSGLPEGAQDFAALNLPSTLTDAIADLGFTEPTAIQKEAIPALLAGRDITGIAQTGTGKTAAFGLPMLASINPDVRAVQALVLAPTRELAIQVAEHIESYAKYERGIAVVPVYGGAPFHTQARALHRGAQIVVGTPGRVIDHLERGTLKLDQVHFLALDEADEMLRMGFAEDVEEIFGHAPAERQVALFSATMPRDIVRVAQRHLNDPVQIAVSRQASTVTSVNQTYAVVPFRHKAGSLSRVLATSEAEAAIVFVRTRSAAEDVGVELVARGISAATISGDVAQKDREKIVERLRDGSLDVLVATDVAARGLDVDRVGLVVNFDIPREAEAYVHRIGRTGRAGRTGEALTFVTPHERGKLRNIERVTRQQLEEIAIPTPADVSAHRAQKLLEGTPARLAKGRLELYRDLIKTHLAESGMDPIDLLATITALNVGDTGPKFDERREQRIEREEGEARAPRERPDRDADAPKGAKKRPTFHGGQRYRVSVGHNHGANPKAIVGAITNEGGLAGHELGKIEIFQNFSLIEINTDVTPEAFTRIRRARVAGQMLRLQVDEGPPGRGNRDRESAGRPMRNGRSGGRASRNGRHGGPRAKGKQKSRRY
ncbi:MAG TPA: DEAD/DEAH box helicase [Actinomycetales bacterium]|nr:DEAD/DEAH box helicase [Actinomycetales bacterium]